jgi:hypothetical protein
MVSSPVADGNSVNVGEFFAPVLSKVVVVWSYDPVNGWLYYIPGGSSNTLLSLNDTMGVWVDMSSNATLTGSGMLPSVPVNVSLSTGWNLVGYSGSSSTLPASAFSSINGEYSVIWSYDEATQAWSWYIPGSSENNLGTIAPGQAYWVMMNEPGVFTPGSN